MNNIQKRKRAFMSLITRPLGFVRSVSGTLPLTLLYAIKGNADNYTIEGRSVQNGTPSPENPIEIQSVGVKTVNLWAAGDLVDIVGLRETAITLPAGTYTISMILTSDGENQKCLVGARKSSDNQAMNLMQLIPNTGERVSASFTIDEEIKSIFNYADRDYASSQGHTFTATDIQIEEGSSASNYEPYGKYKLNVINRGVNLFDYKTLTSRNQSSFPLTINDDGSIEYSGTYYIQADISYLESGKTYTFTCKYTYNGEIPDFKAQYRITYDDGTYILAYHGVAIETDATKKITSLYCYFRKLDSTVFQVKAWDFQIQEGDTATDYEPYRLPSLTTLYLDEPLRGIVKGSNIYKDKIDFESGTIERKVFEHVYTGDETWTTYGQADHTFTSPYLTPNPNEGYIFGTNNGLCSHFIPMAGSTIGTVYGFYAASMNKILFSHLDCSTIDEWKEYLKAESSKGIPLTYLTWDSKNGYTETESVNLPKLPLFEGTNILSIEGDIQPDMTVIYKASVKEV